MEEAVTIEIVLQIHIMVSKIFGKKVEPVA